MNVLFDLVAAHQHMAAGFGQLTVKYRAHGLIRQRLGESLGPGEFDDLRAEIERGDTDVVRIVGQRAQAKYIGAGARGGAELAVGMGEQRALGRHQTAAQNLVAVLHFLRRLVVGLLAEEISDSRRILV